MEMPAQAAVLRMPILFSEGVSKGPISVERFVALTSTNPARLYGLYPQKGTLAVGSDAEITLWDSELQATIRQTRLNHGSNFTPYEGMEIIGWPARTNCGQGWQTSRFCAFR